MGPRTESIGYRRNEHLKFKVLAALLMKVSLVWDIVQCRPLNSCRRFGEASSSLQGRPALLGLP